VTRNDGLLSLNWIRQTRINANSWAGEVPLGETVERYLVRMFQDEILLSETEVNEPFYSDSVAQANRAQISQFSSVYGWGASAEILF